jgi:hypothetical protein
MSWPLTRAARHLNVPSALIAHLVASQEGPDRGDEDREVIHRQRAGRAAGEHGCRRARIVRVPGRAIGVADRGTRANGLTPQLDRATSRVDFHWLRDRYDAGALTDRTVLRFRKHADGPKCFGVVATGERSNRGNEDGKQRLLEHACGLTRDHLGRRGRIVGIPGKRAGTATLMPRDDAACEVPYRLVNRAAFRRLRQSYPARPLGHETSPIERKITKRER